MLTRLNTQSLFVCLTRLFLEKKRQKHWENQLDSQNNVIENMQVKVKGKIFRKAKHRGVKSLLFAFFDPKII